MIVAVKNSNYSCFQSLYTQCFLKIVYLLKLQLIENLFWQIFEKWGLFKVYFSRWYTVCCGTGIVILAQDSGFAIRVLQITLTNSAEYYIGRKKLTRPLNLHLNQGPKVTVGDRGFHKIVYKTLSLVQNYTNTHAQIQ